MTSRRPRATRVTALLTALVTAGILAGQSAQALGGDPAPDGVHAFTAKIDIGGVRACSGTLINNQWLITAASCFADDPAEATSLPTGPPARKSSATIGRTDLTGTTGHVRDIVHLVPRQDRDVVLAKLATPVPGIAPLRPTTTAPVAGESLKGTGYGRTKDTWVPDQLHTGAFTAGQVQDTTVSIDGTPLCKGDTGAPTFREKDGLLELVSVVSRSWQGGCLASKETRTGAIAGRVDDIRTWIRESTASTLTAWKLQMVTKTTSGLYHSMRDSNGDWAGFGDVQKVAGTVEDVKFAADAAISGKNYVFAVGGDGHVYQANRRPTGGWEAFRDLTSEIGAKPGLTRLAVTSTGKGLALIGLADGRIYHATQDPDEKWSKWGDVTAKLGVLGNATQVTTSQTSGGETHVGVVADNKAYHAIRQADGTWSDSWGRISNLPTGLDSINGMAFAGIGAELQIVLTSPTGAMKHATRAAGGSWSTFGNLNGKLGDPAPAVSVDAAAVNGEFQTAVVSTDGRIRHGLRHSNGTWDAPDEPTGYPGTATMAAITGSTS
ncbi:trypsin-like serine protease [Streptomyces sp. NPDC088400]|uniref:trypsin-like serine protease n=1 Tax=Streptomyces sp. NPDC088400 TaxID=3365861 RepID=UPI003823D66B